MINLPEQEETVKKNGKYMAKLFKDRIPSFIHKHPIWASCIFILPILLIILIICLMIHPILGYTFNFVSNIIPSDNNESQRINDIALVVYNNGQYWESNQSYYFNWIVKSQYKFYGHTIVYLRPAIENGLVAPVAYLSEFDKEFEINQTTEFKGNISTIGTSKGSYNVCILIRDVSKTEYSYNFCDNSQINILN